MSLPSTNRRKSSSVVNLEKNKLTTKHNQTKNGIHDKSETHEHMSTVKKSDAPPVSMSTHRKSDADKSIYANAHDKGNHASVDYYEFFNKLDKTFSKEFYLSMRIFMLIFLIIM
jgi:hypothetical protein